jgi:putative DNA primase/helicase
MDSQRTNATHRPNGDDYQEEAPTPIHLTDRGNALRLIKRYGKDLHCIYRWKKWLVWDGSRWVVDEGNRVEALAKEVITQLYLEAKAIIDRLARLLDDSGEIAESARKIREQHINTATATLKWALKSESAQALAGMLKHARSERGIAITPDELDANPWLLNVANGSIDLQTGMLHPNQREDLCTKRLDIAYDPKATCPQWLAFLWRIIGGPKPHDEGLETALQERYERAERLVKFLQRDVGYSLTGVIREQVLFFMYGGGDNGKSTFSETLAALLGEYYQKTPKELLMQKDRRDMGGPSPEIARLCGVRLVIASEVGEHHRLNEAQVKDLTGDDTLTARGLYEAFFQFRPTHKLWMYGNHKPAVQGTDDAIWKRPKLIPFTEKVSPSEQISDFRERYLIPELSGILRWAVQGCLDWQKDGLQVPDEVNAATAAYRREMDAIAAFLEEHCLMGNSYTAKASDLYSTYTQWGESGRETVLPRRKFYDQLRERGCESFPGHANALYWPKPNKHATRGNKGLRGSEA